MAVVLPFAAYRYDEKKVGGLGHVLTQPYDKISPDMQRAYLSRSLYNYAHLIKGEVKAADSSSDNVYTRAAQWLRDWREQAILIQRKTPAFYLYYEKFVPPDSPDATPLIRKSFIGLGKLEHYQSGVIFRHEQTLSAPKADRLDLLRATRANLESLFLLYSDPQKTIEKALDQIARCAPAARAIDEYGVEHTIWDIDDPALVKTIQSNMADKKLIIADGHHRYETALNFERECRTSRHPGEQNDCSFAMMTFVNMESDGILILPTHRLVSNLSAWNAPSFREKARPYFEQTAFPFSDEGSKQEALRRMKQAMAQSPGTSFGALFQAESQNGNAFYCLSQRSGSDTDRLLADLTPAERSLDVTVLHRIVFGQCLGLDEAAIRDEKHLSYVRHFDEGIDGVLKGAAQACFFLNPVRIEQVRDIAFSGRVLPQKSTDFYPKLLSGLVLYTLQH